MKCYLLSFMLLAVWVNTSARQLPHYQQKSPPFETFSTAVLPFQLETDPQPEEDWPAFLAFEILQPHLDQIARLHDRAPAFLLLEIPRRDAPPFRLELERVDLFSGDFQIAFSQPGKRTAGATGIHYRGRVAGREASLAAISIFPDELAGFWSAGETAGNWVLGRLPGSGGEPPPHLLYLDQGLAFAPGFACATPDNGLPYRKADLIPIPGAKQKTSPCIDLFFEVDYDVFRDKGGAQQTIRYATSLFNQVAAVFSQDGIAVQLRQLYIWNTPSVYNGATVEQQLAQFQDRRTGWPGDLAQLLSYKANGGIAAGLDGLCNDLPAARMSYAGIESAFSSIPNYSWTVHVAAHELGHLMGARHTHACVWNGDGSSIDDCGNVMMARRGQEPEGQACYRADHPRYPAAGGTLMSYCHLLEGVGISLAKGFHEQPLAVVRNKIAAAVCLEDCTPAPTDYTCVGNTITLSLVLDDFGSETTWELRDGNGLVLYQGGPYADGREGERQVEELCLGIGCFTFEIRDAYGDGMCCYYGQGAYALTDSSGTEIARGGQFGDREQTEFCLPLQPEAPAFQSDCSVVNFHETTVHSYGGTQDEGEYEIRDEGTTIRLWGNAWKAIPVEYEAGPFTILEFDFGSTAPAEIHAIGVDTDDEVSYNQTFKLYGTQNWGVLQYFNYEYPGEWMSFSIPVGLHYRGPVSKLLFCVDDDEAPVNGDSWFRNIRLYESGDCPAPPAGDAGQQLTGPLKKPWLSVFPNPALDQLAVAFPAPDDKPVVIQLVNLMGQVLKTKISLPSGREHRENLNVTGLPAGAYFIRLETGGEVLVKKVFIAGAAP